MECLGDQLRRFVDECGQRQIDLSFGPDLNRLATLIDVMEGDHIILKKRVARLQKDLDIARANHLSLYNRVKDLWEQTDRR